MLESRLDRYRREARAALENFLDRIVLPTLDIGEVQALELTLSAELRISGGLEPQTLELSLTPLKTRTATSVLTTGEMLPVKTPRLEDYFSPIDLKHIDDILES